MSPAAFFPLAVLALVASLVSILVRSPRRAADAFLAVTAAVAGLCASAGAGLVGAAMLAAGAGAVLLVRRRGAGTAGALCDDARPWRILLPVAAFVALALRPLLMTQWPSAGHGGGPIGLLHFLVASAALFVVGIFAATSRIRVAGTWIGLALMNLGVCLALVAVSYFTTTAQGGRDLALGVVALSVVAALVAVLLAKDEGGARVDDDSARVVASDLAMALVGICFLLLVAAW